MKKFFILFFCFSSVLLASEPSHEISLNNTPTIEQNQNLDNAVLTSAFPHYFKKMLISLGLLIGLLILTAWALKRLMKSREKEINEHTKSKILEKRVLSSKSLLYLVEVDGEKVLLAESHLEIRQLHTLGQKITET
jgi:flagellar biogenesis protein FliO